MKNTSINLKEQTHTDLKVYCAKNQVSMGAMIEAAVIEKMNSNYINDMVKHWEAYRNDTFSSLPDGELKNTMNSTVDEIIQRHKDEYKEYMEQDK